MAVTKDMTNPKLAETEDVPELKHTVDYMTSRLSEYQDHIGALRDILDSEVKTMREKFDRTTCEVTLQELGNFIGESILPGTKNFLYNGLLDRCRPIAAMLEGSKRSLGISELSDVLRSCDYYLRDIQTVLFEADLFKTQRLENPKARLEFSLEQKAQLLLTKLYLHHIHDNFDDPDNDYFETYPVEETLLSNGVRSNREEIKAVVHFLRNRGHINANLKHGLFSAELTSAGVKHLITNKAKILNSIYSKEPKMFEYVSHQISGTNHKEKSGLSTSMKKKFHEVFRELDKIKNENSQLATSLDELRRDLEVLKKAHPKIKSEKKVWEWSLQSIFRQAVLTNVLDAEKAYFIYQKLGGLAKASLPAFKDVLQLG